MTRQYVIFKELVNELINDVNLLYLNDAVLNDYLFGWRDIDEEGGRYSIGPDHVCAFHYADKVATIADACGLSWYTSIGKNVDGNTCAVVKVF